MNAGRVEGSGPGQLEAWNCRGVRTIARPFAVTGFTNLKQTAALKPDHRERDNQTKSLKNIDNI